VEKKIRISLILKIEKNKGKNVPLSAQDKREKRDLNPFF
jgi:hypothetical protein